MTAIIKALMDLQVAFCGRGGGLKHITLDKEAYDALLNDLAGMARYIDGIDECPKCGSIRRLTNVVGIEITRAG